MQCCIKAGFKTFSWILMSYLVILSLGQGMDLVRPQTPGTPGVFPLREWPVGCVLAGVLFAPAKFEVISYICLNSLFYNFSTIS
jgi:hypothetical protein